MPESSLTRKAGRRKGGEGEDEVGKVFALYPAAVSDAH